MSLFYIFVKVWNSRVDDAHIMYRSEKKCVFLPFFCHSFAILCRGRLYKKSPYKKSLYNINFTFLAGCFAQLTWAFFYILTHIMAFKKPGFRVHVVALPGTSPGCRYLPRCVARHWRSGLDRPGRWERGKTQAPSKWRRWWDLEEERGNTANWGENVASCNLILPNLTADCPCFRRTGLLVVNYNSCDLFPGPPDVRPTGHGPNRSAEGHGGPGEAQAGLVACKRRK